MDDIVTRLREKYQGQLPICLEAADEIEDLRAELSEIRRQYVALKENNEHLREHLKVLESVIYSLSKTAFGDDNG